VRTPVSSVVTAAIESPDSCESQATSITDDCRGFDEDFVNTNFGQSGFKYVELRV